MTEITAAAAVGWVVSPVINLIIGKTQNYISNNLFKRAGVEDDIKEMETTLLEILATMTIVERHRIVDQNQAKLVWKIKDAVYDAEYVFDEFEYNVLAKKHEKQQNMVSQIASSPRVIYRDTVGKLMFKNMVKAVNKKLNQAKGSATELRQLIHVNNTTNIQNHEHEPGNWHPTSSLISGKIVGREKERDELIDLLVEQGEGPPTIIQLIGQGGVGKTTLAQIVFNDQRVDNHFDLKMWLTVSDKFDKVRLTKEMLNYVCKDSTVNVAFDMVQQNLKTELASKKILLVLDDVWYHKDDNEKHIYEKEWLEFLAPVNNAKPGSKIVITTRECSTRSNLYENEIRPIMVDGMNGDDSWSLFQLCAFNDKNQSKRQLLEPIGKVIVNNLMGSALAIRVVGSQLRGTSDEELWKRFSSENLADMSDIMKILYRSYERLPQHLKRCFAYCSLFPTDYHLEPEYLVHMWIAQGFVHSEGRKKLEDVGNSYFKALLDRSFFQVIKKDDEEYYVMHDLMNDLACHVSKGECHILDKDDPMRDLGSIRHLSVVMSDEAMDILKNMHGLDKLCTLMFLSDWYSYRLDIDPSIFTRLKRIRVLNIPCKCGTRQLSAIGQCKHLRYLSAQYKRDNFVHMPDSFSKLHLLGAFIIGMRELKFLDDVILLQKFLFSTRSLIFVDTEDGVYIDVGKQVPRHTMWKGGCAPTCVRNEEMRCRLDLLGNITDINGDLEIRGLENATCEEEATKAELGNKKHVTELTLMWMPCDYSVLKVESGIYHAVLEALKPNPNLRDLSIDGYPGDAWPSWLESNFLSTIKSITLENCKKIKMLPPLGQLPLLKNLQISFLDGVRRIGIEFFGSGRFPSLENLVIMGMRSLEEWSYSCPCDSSIFFPKLQQLCIFECPLLELDNDFMAPQYLKTLYIDDLESMSTLFQGDISTFKGLTTLEVSDCPVLITLQGLHELPSLRILKISNCGKLLYLPEMDFFYSLELLIIMNCPELRSFPKRGLPISLWILWIGEVVHHDLKEQIQSKNGRDWDKIAAISGCDFYSSIDQYGVLETHFLFNCDSLQEYLSRKRKKLQKYKIDKHVCGVPSEE